MNSSIVFSDIPNDIIYYLHQLCYEEYKKELSSLRCVSKVYSIIPNTDGLYLSQFFHGNNIYKKFQQQNIICDTSIPGTGKSDTSLWIAQVMNYYPLIIHENGLGDHWNTVAKRRSCDCTFVTYTRLSLGLTSIIKRDDKGKYSATLNLYEQFGNRNILLILDEADNIKNKSGKNKSVDCLINALKYNSNNKILVLSATLLDKKEHVYNMCKALGFIKSCNVQEGIKDFIDSLGLDDKEKESITNLEKSTPRKMYNNFVYDLFVKIYKPKMMVAMDIPNYGYNIKLQNSFYNLNDKESHHCKLYINKIEEGYDKVMKKYDSIEGWNIIHEAYKGLHKVKSDMIIRIAKRILDKDILSKVIIVHQFTDPLLYTNNELKDYGSHLYYGKSKNRHDIINNFNNNDKNRVLVANIKVVAKGLSLHDTIGNRKRTMLILPTYYAILMHQVSHRIYRRGLRSDASVEYIYCNIFKQELDILNSLCEKSSVMRDMVHENVSIVKYPGEYDKIICS